MGQTLTRYYFTAQMARREMWIMLPTNFAFLASENPELKPVIIRLGEWARKHCDWNLIDPRAVSREIRDIDPFLLSFVLHQLVVKGLFRQVYMVATPSGVLQPKVYDDPNPRFPSV